MRKGWTETTLGEVVFVVNGGTPSTKKPQYWNGVITWITTTELTHFDGKIIGDSQRTLTELGLIEGPSKLVEKGTILLGTTATIGTIGFVEKPVAFNQQISGLQVKSNQTDPWYLFFFLQSIKYILENLSAGTSFKRISTSVLKSVRINLPPLQEQKRIVDLISSVDSYIDALQHQADSARKSRNAVLHEMLSAGGDGWTETTLGEAVSYSIGGIWGDDPGDSEIDIAVYRQTEFSHDGILVTPADANRSMKKSQAQTRLLKFGDVLIQKSAGTPTLPGRVVMVRDIPEGEAVFSNFLNLIRADTHKCIPEYLFLLFWIKHKNGRAFEYQRGTNIKNLDLPNYLLETILLPPLQEQERIVDLISSMDDAITTTEVTIAETRKLRSGLLSDLLSGDHEIPASYDKITGAA